MKKFGLEERYIDFIKKILNKNFDGGNFYIFGSRAKGKSAEYSDIDIAIDYKGKIINAEMISRAAFEFENSTFPYEVDLVDLNNLPPIFEENVRQSMVKI